MENPPAKPKLRRASFPDRNEIKPLVRKLDNEINFPSIESEDAARIAQILNEKKSRRDFLKIAGGAVAAAAVGAVAIGTLGAYIIPKASAQGAEIDVGILQVPIDFNNFSGVTKDQWYSDTIDYQSTNYTIGSSQNQNLPHFHFRSKYDANYVYQALEAFNVGTNLYLNTYFKTDQNAIYNLILQLSSGSAIEINTAPDGKTKFAGTPFSNKLGGSYVKEQDYDYKIIYGPSDLDQTQHLQVLYEFRTNILTAIPNLNSTNSLVSNGITALYGPMVFKAYPVDEFSQLAAALVGSLAIVAGARELSKRRLSRRELLRLQH